MHFQVDRFFDQIEVGNVYTLSKASLLPKKPVSAPLFSPSMQIELELVPCLLKNRDAQSILLSKKKKKVVSKGLQKMLGGLADKQEKELGMLGRN